MTFPLLLGDPLGGGSSSGAVEDVVTPVPAPVRSGWESLRGVLAAAAADAEQVRLAPVVACPNDGEPLRVGPAGQLFCPFDGWQPTGW